MWLTVGLLLFVFQIVTVVFSEFRRPAKGFAWVLLLFVFPLLGLFLYYFLARDYRRRSKVKRGGLLPPPGFRAYMEETFDSSEEGQQRLTLSPQQNDQDALHVTWMSLAPFPDTGTPFMRKLYRLLHTMPYVTVGYHNEMERFAAPNDAYERMLDDIGQAKTHIHLLYYTWNDDEIGKRFYDALLNKVREGVQVRIIFDGIGSYATADAFWRRLRQAGAEVHCFLPIWVAFFAKRINYRNHRKVTIIDECIGYVGGANIGDEYVGKNRKLGYWRDTVLRLEGDGVTGLQQCFWRDWQFVTQQPIPHRAVPRGQYLAGHTVYIVPSGPDLQGDALLELLFFAFSGAQKRIWVTTPYFIPDVSLKTALKCAALAGVDVRIVIPSVEDTVISLWATRSYLEELLQYGVRIFRYQKGFMHAKTVVIDDVLATVGSANIDLRSLYHNFELNAVLFDPHMIGQLADDVVRDMQDSEELTYEQYVQRDRWERIQEWIGRAFVPLL